MNRFEESIPWDNDDIPDINPPSSEQVQESITPTNIDIPDTHKYVPSSVLNAIEDGRNLMLHGSGGTGKSTMLRAIARHLISKGKKVVLTATTGVAAANLSEGDITACTLHSWSGIGVCDKPLKQLIPKIKKDKSTVSDWNKCDVLIIDEMSMLGKFVFTCVDWVGRACRCEKYISFGGIQVIVSGDWLQLPPVKDDYAFKSKYWNDMNWVFVDLSEPKRYDDTQLWEILQRVRYTKHTTDDIKILETRVTAYRELISDPSWERNMQIVPTRLYSTRKRVGRLNEQKLHDLPGEPVVFVAQDKYTQKKKTRRPINIYEKMLNDAIPSVITLKPGSQVMLKRNISVGDNLVNGSRGVVLSATTERVTVQFMDGKIHTIIPQSWTVEDGRVKASRTQIPFILAWALTIHSVQGCTLDSAIVDLGPSIFAESQAYVALSRVRNLETMYITDLDPSKFQSNDTARSYAEVVKDNSLEL